tara:strand:- start:9 stop:269 length:261 start_codon:yes stop_codon:yes gene_type:complete
MDFNKLSNCLEIIDKNKPIRIMVYGRWHAYSHYELTFDNTTIWMLNDLDGCQIPLSLHQIEQWHAVDPSDELKAAIAELKEMIIRK